MQIIIKQGSTFKYRLEKWFAREKWEKGDNKNYLGYLRSSLTEIEFWAKKTKKKQIEFERTKNDTSARLNILIENLQMPSISRFY